MPILNKENIEEVKKYKQFVDNYDSSSLMQSMSWADVKSGWKSEYVYIEEDGKIVMAMALLIRTFIAGKTLIYAPRGPVGNVYDIDKVKELMNVAVPAFSSDNQISNIIVEEVEAYFQGQKTVDDVAGIIQSRVQIYVNENR